LEYLLRGFKQGACPPWSLVLNAPLRLGGRSGTLASLLVG